MSVLLTKVLWYKFDDRNTENKEDDLYLNPVVIADVTGANSAKGLDIKNNVLSLNLKNAFQGVTTDPGGASFDRTRYVGEDGELLFSEQDQIKIYAKYTDDGADVESIDWSDNANFSPESTYLLGVYYVIEFNPQHSEKHGRISLKCADKTYVLFNRILSRSFTSGDAINAPEMIQKIARFTSQNPEGKYLGTGGDDGVRYDIDAKLVSEGGFITDTRRSTREDGTTNTDTTFPDKEMAKVWKPVYEWMKDISQIEMFNTSDELSGVTAVVYGRPFILWIDEDDKLHWVYASDTVDKTLVVGTDNIYSNNLTKRVFDVTNMIIYNAGADMYNSGVLDYVVDLTANVKTLKMRYVPMIDIAKKWIDKDYSQGFNVASTREGTPAGFPAPQFVQDANYALSACAFVPTATHATAASIDSDSKYNVALRERCLVEGEKKASALLKGLSNARWKGRLSVKGASYTAGNLVNLTDRRIGLNGILIRILDVRHSFSKTRWITHLDLEQDSEVLTTNA